MLDNLKINVDGHVKIWDPVTGEVFVDQHNAINSEAMSKLIADSLSKLNDSYIYEMHFGNGGTIIDETGNITYKDVVVNLENGFSAGLFNDTYFKVVDKNDSNGYNPDPDANYITVEHTTGLNYSDVVITCTLKKEEPSLATSLNRSFNLAAVSQADEDTAANFNGEFVFDEIGLKSKSTNSEMPLNAGWLLSHIVFHPVQKSANRVIQVKYTLRIRIV
jgi:hypothetical protein